MKGGHASCPSCNKAVPVPGGPEALFWILLSMSILGGLGVTIGLWMISPALGLITLVIVTIGIVIALLAA